MPDTDFEQWKRIAGDRMERILLLVEDNDLLAGRIQQLEKNNLLLAERIGNKQCIIKRLTRECGLRPLSTEDFPTVNKMGSVGWWLSRNWPIASGKAGFLYLDTEKPENFSEMWQSSWRHSGYLRGSGIPFCRDGARGSGETPELALQRCWEAMVLVMNRLQRAGETQPFWEDWKPDPLCERGVSLRGYPTVDEIVG